MDPVTLCECLSPQELRVKDRIDGKVDRFRKTHERSFRMLERFDGKKPSTLNAPFISPSP